MMLLVISPEIYETDRFSLQSREYIEQLEGASVIEDDYLEVDESDLDVYGRISTI